MFQCYSLKSSHPCLLQTEPKSLFFISVSLLLSCIQGHHYCLSKFHIQVSIYCIIFFLLTTSLCIIGSSFIYLIRTDSNAFFCVYVPQLSYPFVCQWTSRLLPCPSYCKQCCSEYWGTCISFNSGFLGVYTQQWDYWVVWQFYFQFFKESPLCSPQWLYQFAFPPTV